MAKISNCVFSVERQRSLFFEPTGLHVVGYQLRNPESLLEIRNLNLGEAPGFRSADRVHYALDMWPNVRPLLLAKYDHGNLSIGKTLLVTHVLIRRNENLETCFFRCRQKFTVPERIPALTKSRRDDMSCQIMSDGQRRCLVQKNAHFRVLGPALFPDCGQRSESPPSPAPDPGPRTIP